MEKTQDNNHGENGVDNGGRVVGYVDATSGLSEISSGDIKEVGDGGGSSNNGLTGSEPPCLVDKKTRGGIYNNHGVSAFLTNLYLMVDNKETNSIISWGSSCTTFIIYDKQELISKILPLHFKNGRFDNFIAQLNNYGFKKTAWNRLEFEHECFQEGKLHLLKTIKRKKQQSNGINKTCVQISELKATFDNVRHEQKQISNRIRRFNYDIERTLLEVQTTTKEMINKLLSIFSEAIGRKRTFLDIDQMIDFVDIEKDFQAINDQYGKSWSDVDGLMMLSELKEKGIAEYGSKGGEGSRRGCGDGCRVPKFLHDLYNMVEKEEIDDLISWKRPCCASFIISDINEFATRVLPMYFKHKNFSSFNSQLNIYGFKKVSWEKHEYANEWFQGGRYDLLANIKRRNKSLRLVEFAGTCSKIEVEVFNNRLKAIQQDQERKIIRLLNYEEQIKCSVHEFKGITVSMANVVEKMIEKSSEKFESIKKAKPEFEQNVIGNGKEQEPEVNELETTPQENNNLEVQYYCPESEMIEELGFDRGELDKILMEWETHALNDTHIGTMDN